MKRILTWPALCLGVGLVLIAAMFALVNDNSGLTTALLVVAVSEAVFGSAMVAFAQRKRRV